MDLLRRLALIAAAVSCLFVLAACSSDLLEELESAEPATSVDYDVEPAETEPDEAASSEDSQAEPTSDVAGYDPALERGDDLCLPEDPEGTIYTVAHQVVDGVLGALCHGSETAPLLEAWQVLADLTPPGQLRDLGVFTGFAGESDENSDNTLIAYVAPTADDSLFEMAINLANWGKDSTEDSFSIAHEFAHVFTGTPAELDAYADPADCPNYDGGGVGCYEPESIMAQWYDEFWADTGYSPTADDANDPDVGEKRCTETPGFFGEYAASNPEEDFAEAFAAYVMALEAATPEEQARLDWIDQFVGLREFKERAERFGYSPQESTLAVCGS